ncbi:ATP-binding protein [Streptomyces sp. NPDC048384]|uniref:ATP-binding protein n=1 Tax=Streptomyces sp. NPDC048384 TaxID=3155487 RepID=UPI00342AA2E3
MTQEASMPRRTLNLAFTAEPAEVAALRRAMRLQLGLWGLHEVIDQAQLCVSELASNVIAHVGHGTPATLVVAMNGVRLRIEVHDPDARALPALVDTDSESENGRGMALIDAVAERWGVQLHPDRKATWCELATGPTASDGHVGHESATRTEVLLGLYAEAKVLSGASNQSKLSRATAEEAVIDVVADVLHWLRAHGCDVDHVLDRAQTHFEAQIKRAEELPCRAVR